jgi:hypothetical protein
MSGSIGFLPGVRLTFDNALDHSFILVIGSLYLSHATLYPCFYALINILLHIILFIFSLKLDIIYDYILYINFYSEQNSYLYNLNHSPKDE